MNVGIIRLAVYRDAMALMEQDGPVADETRAVILQAVNGIGLDEAAA